MLLGTCGVYLTVMKQERVKMKGREGPPGLNSEVTFLLFVEEQLKHLLPTEVFVYLMRNICKSLYYALFYCTFTMLQINFKKKKIHSNNEAKKKKKKKHFHFRNMI